MSQKHKVQVVANVMFHCPKRKKEVNSYLLATFCELGSICILYLLMDKWTYHGIFETLSLWNIKFMKHCFEIDLVGNN